MTRDNINRKRSWEMAIGVSDKLHTARKAGPCANAAAAKRGVEWAQDCSLMIAAGDHYVDGDLNLDKAGGFGRDRYCMSCAERGLA
jgi:hypothetical protein